MIQAIRKYKTAILPILMGAAMFARGLNMFMNPEANPNGLTTASGISMEGLGLLILSAVLIGFGLYKIIKS